MREFSAMTHGLLALADWLQQCGIRRVAMESTGVYWIPLYELLCERGLEVALVDGRKIKTVAACSRALSAPSRRSASCGRSCAIAGDSSRMRHATCSACKRP